MTKPKKYRPPTCPFCKAELKEGRCEACGGWPDSLGHFHQRTCSGGFHDKCEEKPKP